METKPMPSGLVGKKVVVIGGGTIGATWPPTFARSGRKSSRRQDTKAMSVARVSISIWSMTQPTGRYRLATLCFFALQ